MDELSIELQEWLEANIELEYDDVVRKLSELEAKIAEQEEVIRKVRLYAWSEGLSLKELLEG